MTELKPCPKGCDSYISVNVVDTAPGWWVATIRCTDCSIEITRGAGTEKKALEKAIEAWNTRAERTCKWEAVTDPNGKITEFMGECGCCMGYVPNYCPNCGAKVVE